MAIRRSWAGTLCFPFLLCAPAAAQTVPGVRCAASVPNLVTVRTDGRTELLGDLVLTCTGGTPTPAGMPVPLVNFQLTLNTSVTSRLLSAFSSDALLLIDDPSPANQALCPGSCPLTGVGGAGINYQFPGAPSNQGQPVYNAFQGRVGGAYGIQFLGVPFYPPGTNGTRVIRITNIRANASQLAANLTLTPPQIAGLIASAGQVSVPIDNPRQTLATVQPGLTSYLTPQGAENQNPTGVIGAQILPQCQALNPDLATNPAASPPSPTFQIRFTEGYASAFKTQGGPAQNTPGMLYNTESGFRNPSFPIDFGTADSGTRLRAIFSNVPANARLFVSSVNDPAASSATARARAVSSGSGPAEPARVQVNGLVEVPITNGTGSTYWEMTSASRLDLERLAFYGWLSYPPLSNATAASLGTIGAFLSFTPATSIDPNRRTDDTSIPTFSSDGLVDPLRSTLNGFIAARLESCATADPALQVGITPAFQNNTFTVTSESSLLALNIFLSSTRAARPVNVTPVISSAANPMIREATAGWLSVSQSQATTPMTIRIQANGAGLPPGEYMGGVRLESPGTPPIVNQLPVRMIVLPPGPRFAANGVVDAASYSGGAVVPGQAIVVFGSGFGPSQIAGLALNEEGRVASTLGETRVLFDEAPSPMIYAVNGQLSAFVPFSVSGKLRTEMRIEYRGVRSPPVFLPVSPALPGIFTADSSGFGQGAILNQDGSPNSAANPANPGDVIVIFASGAGQTDPPGVDGRLAGLPLPALVQPVTALIDGKQAEVLYAGPAPGLAEGMLQVNARIPADSARGGNVDVTINAGAFRSQPGVTAAVR